MQHINTVGIIDYGLGNIQSLNNTLIKLGYRSKILRKKSDGKNISTIIFPGVGSFDYAMNSLRKTGLDEYLYKNCLEGKKKFIGICLGMQILFNCSKEGNEKGLGFFDGDVINFKNEECHVGWNLAKWKNNKTIKGTEAYYFNHSFKVECSEMIALAHTYYQENSVSAVGHNNIFGIQFHPEKSQSAGLRALKQIIGLKTK